MVQSVNSIHCGQNRGETETHIFALMVWSIHVRQATLLGRVVHFPVHKIHYLSISNFISSPRLPPPRPHALHYHFVGSCRVIDFSSYHYFETAFGTQHAQVNATPICSQSVRPRAGYSKQGERYWQA